MRLLTTVVASALFCLAMATEEEVADDTEYTNTWVAEIHGGEEIAKRVARDHGYIFEGPVDPFDDHYVLIRDDHPEVSKRNSVHLTRSLTDLQEVRWAEQQAVVKRTKRGLIPEEFPEEQLYNSRDFDNTIPEEHNSYVPRDGKTEKENDLFALLLQHMNSNSDNFFEDFWSDDWWSDPGSSSWSSSWSWPGNGNSKTGSSSSSSKPGNGNSKTGSSSSSKPENGNSKTGSSSSSKPEKGNSKTGSSSSSKPGNKGSKTGSSRPSNSGGSSSQTSSSSGGSGISLSYISDLAAEIEGSSQVLTATLGRFTTRPLDKSILSTYAGTTKHIGSVSTKLSAYASLFNDPLWTKQWYTQDYRTSNMPVMDHNVVPVYRMGITGRGVKVAVVDDGVEHGHPDLKGNFLQSLSYDMCNNRNGSTPDPPYQGHANSHGTKCAGEIAMVANNSMCGVGIAYHAQVAGVKTLGKRSYDLVEARGLVHRLDKFDIYSNSWGPSDDGRTMEKMGSMVAKSIVKGVTEGRKGKGAIYTFAAGNGRHQGDNCAADGFINNAYTIPIASVSQHGKVCYYSERCTAIFATTYSGGNRYDEKVATIDVNGKCATDFSGTSAATPIATGIIALTLQANPDLTYRDVMHLITMTAEVAPLANNEDIWYKNGRGFWVSNDFGFGLLNAENMVRAAKTWKNVPNKTSCVINAQLEKPQYLTVGKSAKVQFKTSACQGTKNAVNYLEQIEVASTVDYPNRGALSITLKSPAGTVSSLLEPRKSDSNKNGLKEWSIKSVHNWGEDPQGTWVITVTANALEGVAASSGYVHGFTVTLHGTARQPSHYNQTPVRKYSAFRLPNNDTSEV